VTLLAFWGHIRDRHRLVEPSLRLVDVIRSGKEWLDYDQSRPEQGRKAKDHDLSRLAQQTQEPGFTWDVLRAWKLDPSRKRVFTEYEDEEGGKRFQLGSTG
jgi:hypothetical protein